MTTEQTISQLRLDIQYQIAVLKNGWYDTQIEKYEAQAELQHLDRKLLIILQKKFKDELQLAQKIKNK